MSKALALAHKHPGLGGIRTRAGEIVAFPPGVAGVDYDLDGLPTQAYVDQAVTDWEASPEKKALEREAHPDWPSDAEWLKAIILKERDPAAGAQAIAALKQREQAIVIALP